VRISLEPPHFEYTCGELWGKSYRSKQGGGTATAPRLQRSTPAAEVEQHHQQVGVVYDAVTVHIFGTEARLPKHEQDTQ